LTHRIENVTARSAPPALWPYATPGILDHLFDRLPGIPMTERETRVLMLCQLQLPREGVIWDIGAGTGTISVEAALLCPACQVVAIERDEEVAGLIRRNCDRFGVTNVTIVEGTAPDCLADLAVDLGQAPDRVIVEGSQSIKDTLHQVWAYLKPQGRIVATTASLEGLYGISEALSELQARNINVVQSAVNRLVQRGTRQRLSAADPIFILSGEKLE
jgi:cobalt-precorrin-6B (C15)-methyltransferase